MFFQDKSYNYNHMYQPLSVKIIIHTFSTQQAYSVVFQIMQYASELTQELVNLLKLDKCSFETDMSFLHRWC